MSIISAGTTTTTAFKVTGDTTGSLVFKTGAGAGTTALTIDASQNATFVNPVTFSGAVVAPAGTVSAPGITTTGDTNTGIFFPAADTIAFAEGGTEAMRLDSAGNVGIGTSSPGAKLDIRSGNLFFSSTSTTANTTLASIGVYQFNYPTTNQYASIDFLNGPSSWFSGSAIVFKTNGSADTTANAATEKMRLDGSGNLGLGVTPSAWAAGIKVFEFNTKGGLAAAGSDVNLLYNTYYDGANKYRTSDFANNFQMASGQFRWYTAPSGTAGGTISFTQAMTLDASGNLIVGNVGSGVSTATPIIVTAGSTFANTSGDAAKSKIRVYSDSSGAIYGFGVSSLLLESHVPASAGFAWFTNNTERARITAGGDFELGTNAGTGTRNLTITTNTSGNPTLILSAAGVDSGQLWYGRADSRLYARSSNTGGVYLASGGTSWTAVSDERKKDIIEPIANAAEKVASLRAVVGKYKTDKDGVRRSFLIAQDVQAVFPEAVDASDENELGLSYTDTIPLLVAAIKEQQEQIKALQDKVAALETK